VKNWTIRSRLALWTAFFLMVELIIFGIASGWVIYNDQLEAFGAIRNQPTPIVVRKETDELIYDLTSAYAAALAVAVLVAALGVWWFTRKALQPLQEVASAAEQIDAKALSRRLPEPRTKDEVGRLVQILNRSFDRLERSFEQATRFSSDASHELKTPLTIMRGEIESALKEEVDNPRIQSLLDSLLAETQCLCDIVEKLLLLSRADAGTLNLTKEILDFSAICHELVEDAEILARPKRITIEFEISPDVEVMGDESYLRRVLLNLLDNAIKYNFRGGSLSISLTRSGGLAVLRIANLGPGIPKEHEARVFERFYRADPSRSSDTSGSGLGLSICREIVAAHGGQMWLDQPGSGWTAFFVTLQLMEGHPLEEPFSRKPDTAREVMASFRNTHFGA
jgi:heavy metal sensor kinase